MKLRAPGRTRIIVPGPRPNAGVRAGYARALNRLLTEMLDDVDGRVLSSYRQLLYDASLRSTLRALRAKWTSSFDSASSVLSQAFANNVLRHSDLAFSAALSKAGFTVPFHVTPQIQAHLTQITKRNVGLIKSIPRQFFREVQDEVFASVKAGRNLTELTEHLHERYTITRRRAGLIARDQNNKATSSIHRLRQLELGITRGIWNHTAASLQPRPEHQDFNGQEYDIQAGHDFDDGAGPVQPGEDINCGCFGSSIIPGYDTEDQPQLTSKEA